MTSEAGPPSIEELDQLPTEELRRRAFDLAEDKRDIGFFWEIVRHLPSSGDIAVEDASSGNIGGSIGETIEIVQQMAGGPLGDAEPLLRARFIDYIRRGK